MKHTKPLIWIFTALGIIALTLIPFKPILATYHFANFEGRPPIHTLSAPTDTPKGLSPSQIKKAYNLPISGGQGTIALIGAYDDLTIEKDLNIFSKQFNLPACTSANGCFTKHLMAKTNSDSNWALETSLDVEWAHAIAPQAKILLVEAKTPSGQNLINAIDYARKHAGVVAISMSFGGAEFPEETSLDTYFKTANKKITFFASSGDNGAGASWPAVSPYVVAVGGTYLNFSNNTIKETAWDGSGGGISAYESEPNYQINYNLSRAKNMRAIPDVAYNADPHSGFSVYKSAGAAKGWYVVGGTSAGAPQWAAIKALSLSADNNKFYADKAGAKNNNYFRDITSGANGNCGYYCQARKHYDYVTGLGSPLTSNF